MPRDVRNEGIYIAGGSLKADQVAVGRGARSTQREGATRSVDDQDRRLETALRHLRKEVREGRMKLGDPKAVTAALAELEAELAKKGPERDRVDQCISRVTAGAGSVAAVVKAAESVRRLLESLY